MQKMKNKVKYLQAVLHEPVPEPNPKEDPTSEIQSMCEELMNKLKQIICLYFMFMSIL